MGLYGNKLGLGGTAVCDTSMLASFFSLEGCRLVVTHSHCVLMESLDEDEFNNNAVGSVHTNHSFFSLLGVFNQPHPSQLPVSLLSMFLCPPRESDKDLPSAWYSLCSQKGEKSGCKIFLLQGFPVFPSSYNPQHTQLNVWLLKSHRPHLHSCPLPLPLHLHSSLPLLLCSLLTTKVCCRTEIKAATDLQEGHNVSQHHWQGLQTQTHTRMSCLVGWLAHWVAVFLTS